MTDLVVELYGTQVGMLAGTWRTFDFLPEPAAVASSASTVPSFPRRSRSPRCR